MKKYTIDEIKKFQEMFDNIINNEQSEIRDLAITEYMSSRGVRYSAIDSLLYAIKVKTNLMIYDIENQPNDEEE